MCKPATNILRRYRRQGLGQSVSKCSLGARLEGAKGGLELRDTPLEGIEVRGVRGEIHHPGSGGYNQFQGFGGVMKLDVVQHDDVNSGCDKQPTTSIRRAASRAR